MTAARAERVEGVLVVDKPSGPSSFDIVAQARRLFRTREVGHAGTLDPLATGVLVLLFGQATKLSAYLTAADKSYRATLAFGASTDTFDAAGTVVSEQQLRPGWSDTASFREALERERLRQQQLPPSHSAVKVQGERAYKLARRGESVTLASRPVCVKHLELLEQSDTHARFELCVSKGYFVRSFARDLCETLGVAGHLAQLTRTQSGCFGLDEAVSWPPSTLPELVPLPAATKRALPSVTLSAEGQLRAKQGKLLTAEHFDQVPAGSASAWLSADGNLVALGTEVVTTGAALAEGESAEDESAEGASTQAAPALPALGGSTRLFRVLRGFV